MQAAFLSRGIAAAAGASAQQVDDRRHVRPDRVEPIRIDAAVAEQRIDQAVGGVRHEHEVVVEIGFQPTPDPALHPVGVVLGADPPDGALRGGDALDLAQHALAVVGKRPGEQLALGFERHLIGALRGAEHRDYHADDGHGDDDADRHHDAQAHVVPADSLPFFADARRSHDQLSCPLGRTWAYLWAFCAP